jgi:hypothetical protein
MFRLALGCVLATSVVAAADPIIYRTFPDAGCAFSLPDREWEWLDPARAPSPANTLAFARNRSGLAFVLQIKSVKPGERVTARSYKQIEEEVVPRENRRKLGSRHLIFKGVPSYQFDMERRDDGNWSRALLSFSDNRLYVLNVQSSRGPVPDEADALFERFKFLDTPRPMLPPHDGDDEAPSDPVRGIGARLGEWLTGLGSVLFVLLLLFGAWAVIRIRG